MRMNTKPKMKKYLVLLLLLGGTAGASLIVFTVILPSSKKNVRHDTQAFGDLLQDQQMQDNFDDATMPDELLRAQRAKQAGNQFASANYGKGSLSYVKGSLEQGEGAQGDESAEGAKGGGKGGYDSGGSSPLVGAKNRLDKAGGSLGSRKSAFGADGSGSGAGSSGQGSRSGTRAGTGSGKSGGNDLRQADNLGKG